MFDYKIVTYTMIPKTNITFCLLSNFYKLIFLHALSTLSCMFQFNAQMTSLKVKKNVAGQFLYHT